MTGPSASLDEFVLHPSVAVRWWLYHLPLSLQALRFLEQVLIPQHSGVVAIEGIAGQVFSTMADDLRGHADRGLARQLSNDVLAMFDHLRFDGTLRVVLESSVSQSAFLISVEHGISYADGLSVALSVFSGVPLLLADRELYETFSQVALAEPPLKLAWLPDHVDI